MQRLLLVLLLLVAGCGRSPDPDAVLLVVIDTLRADRVGCYGDESASTPTLDALAARGVLFEDVTAAVPVTLPSVTSLLTGRWPFHHRVRDNDGFVVGEDETTLVERLAEKGWRTEAVLASAVLTADRGLARGFDHYDDDFVGPYPLHDGSLAPIADELGRTMRRATDVTDRAIQRIRSNAMRGKYFLFAHYFDPHTPLDPPPSFAKKHPMDPYAAEVSYADAELGRLIQAFRAHHPDGWICVVSDHGEGLGDHGELAHGFLLHQSTLRVPWLLSGPGVPAGVVVEDPVSLVDVEPTLARLLDLPAQGSLPARDGVALDFSSAVPPRALYAETLRTLIAYDWSELRAVRQNDRKLITDRAGRVELYDLAKDPDETTDLASTATADSLLTVLEAWTGHEDPEAIKLLAESGFDPDRAEMLATLGYVGGNETTAERPNPKERLASWSARQEFKARLRLGMAHVEQGRMREGIALLDGVLAERPDEVDALYYRGLAREALGEADAGLADLLAAEAIDSTYTPLQLEFAAREEENGAVDAAWRRLSRLANDAIAQKQLAASYLRHGENREAVHCLEHIVDEIEPGDFGARLQLVDALLRSERRFDATSHLRAILHLAPATDPAHRRAQEWLDRLGD